MVVWEFSFSAYFVNVFYISSINETYWDKPENKIVDYCGPSNLISSGFVLWLLLVPAIACVVQLPGSVFLYRRSNFYRFAPEIGLADCLATVCLIVRAIWKGYRWKESIAAVFLVREGVGKGDLWWRETASSRELSNPDSNAADIEGASAEDHQNPEHTQIKAQLKPYANPVSLERMIGTSLFILALVKTIVLLAATFTNAAIRVASLIALAYSTSFVVFEILVWSLALLTPGYSLEDVPAENFLELIQYVDPGDNPFTFPRPKASPNSGSPTDTMELGSISTPNPNSSIATLRTSNTPWNKAVAVSAGSLGVLGPLMWICILTSIWKPSKSVFFLTTAALAFLGVRLLGKMATRITHLRILSSFPLILRTFYSKSAEMAKRLYQRSETEPSLFAIRWVWERATTVNLFAAIWVTVVGIYCVRIFPQHSLEGLEEPPAKPNWLDWLG